MMNLLRLRALAMPEVGLLILRLVLGGTMLVNHGVVKLSKFSEYVTDFHDPLGIGSRNSLILALFAEVLCSALLIVGFLTRFAAINLAITMAVAFFLVHKGALTGPNPGELAFIYLTSYLALMFTGAGRYSVDGDD